MGRTKEEQYPLLDRSASEAHELLALNQYDLSEGEADDEDSTKHLGDTKRRLLGCLLSLLLVIIMASGLTAVQMLNQTVPHSELNGLRFTVTLLICAGYSTIKRDCDLCVPKSNRSWVFLAALSCTLISYTSYGKAYYIPVGSGHGLTLSMELFLNNIVACVIHRSARWNEVLASLMCILGLILTVQPAFMFHEIGPTILDANITFQTPCVRTADENVYITSNFTNSSVRASSLDIEEIAHETTTGYILCFVEALSTVVLFNVIRYRLGDLNVVSLNLWMSLSGVALSFMLMGFMEDPVLPTATTCSLVLVTHMLAAGASGFLYARAAQLISPVWMVLFSMLKIPLLFTLQYTLLAGLYPGYGNAAEIVGAVTILIANAIIPVTELSSYRRDNS